MSPAQDGLGHLVRPVLAVLPAIPEVLLVDAPAVVTPPLVRLFTPPTLLNTARVSQLRQRAERQQGDPLTPRLHQAGLVGETKPGGAVTRDLGVTVATLALLPALVTPVLALSLPVTHLTPGETPPVTAPPARALPSLPLTAPGGGRGGVHLVTVLGLLAGLETFSSPRTLEVLLPELTETAGLWEEITALAWLLALVPVVVTLRKVVTNPNTVKTILGVLVAFTFPLTR